MRVSYILSSGRDCKVFLRKEMDSFLGFCGKGQFNASILVGVIIQDKHSVIVLYGTGMFFAPFTDVGSLKRKGIS